MKLKIAVLPGDGIGPEIMSVALDVVKATAKKFNHQLEYQTALVGACAIDATGSPYPEETHRLCMESDAVLFAAIGSPKYDNDPTAKVRPEQGLLAMRKQLGLYANIRPVTTFPGLIHKSPLRADLVDGADFICIRELTGGLYFGRPQGRSEDGQTAYDTCVYSRYEIERIVRLAYQYAEKRRKKVTVVDKANILATSRLWREVGTRNSRRTSHRDNRIHLRRQCSYAHNTMAKRLRRACHRKYVWRHSDRRGLCDYRFAWHAAVSIDRHTHIGVRTYPRLLPPGCRQRHRQPSRHSAVGGYDA